MEQSASASFVAVSSVVVAAGISVIAWELARQNGHSEKSRRYLWSSSQNHLNFKVLPEKFKVEILKRFLAPGEINVTFEKFPYFISDRTREVLLNTIFLRFRQSILKAFFSSRVSGATALLCGTADTEVYKQTVAKALAKHFDAKLLIFDFTEVASTVRDKPNGSQFLQLLKSSADSQPDNYTAGWGPAMVDALVKVLTAEAAAGHVILYIRDIERSVFGDSHTLSALKSGLQKLPQQVFVLGSYLHQAEEDLNTVEMMSQVFPTRLCIKPPEEEALLATWTSQLEKDARIIQERDNHNLLCEVMLNNNVECEDFASFNIAEPALSFACCEEIVGWAVSNHLMNVSTPELHGGRLVIPAACLEYGVRLYNAEDSTKLKLRRENTMSKELQDSAGKTDLKVEIPTDDVEAPKGEAPPAPVTDASKGAHPAPANALKPACTPKKAAAADPVKEVAPDTEFEKRIRPEVIPAGEVGVTFDSIGALENVKDTLRELVMLPLQRPELFKRGGLIQPCKGILLFGPPGTGKTMLAKAVATEAGANFINISMSTITSKWFGEDEKNVRALFSLAAKIAPTVIFIDEVDSMLGRRSRAGEHEAMRKIKNEFMAHWDGLMSKDCSSVLVLAATNRPFDLDEAIIRRFQRRIMIGLPDVENRKKILTSILAKEDVATDLDFQELAVLTEGHSGSDLKNLCMTAAYQPIREILEQERKLREEAKEAQQTAAAEGQEQAEPPQPSTETESDTKLAQAQAQVLTEKIGKLKLRSLTMEDLKVAKGQVAASVAMEGTAMSELNEWNELYGEGGTRKKAVLSYFL
eukprot:jgi/Mesen1/1943/ME000146S01022